jgi:hypothetical protein
MTRIGSRITTLAALLAVAAAAVAVYSYTARTDHASLAAGSAVRAGSVDTLHGVLLPENLQPAGSVFQESTIAEANAGFTAPTDIVVSPVACLGTLEVALGKSASQLTGWVQVGKRSATAGGGLFQSAVATVPGGLSIDALRQAVRSCTAGTITWKALGVTARISLREISAPVLNGAQTLSFTSTITFLNVTRDELTSVAACPVEQISTVACTTSTGPAVRANVTRTQFFGFATTGDIVFESCEATQALTDQMITTLFARAESSGLA